MEGASSGGKKVQGLEKPSWPPLEYLAWFCMYTRDDREGREITLLLRKTRDEKVLVQRQDPYFFIYSALLLGIVSQCLHNVKTR
jgi:hypothetical protein